jgi:tetratricopeptide (TPR) repeat protein
MTFFRRKKAPVSAGSVQERWSSGFHLFQQKRFAREQTADYVARPRRGRLALEILKANCFAWVTSPFRYGDFVLEGRIAVDPANGHSAAGFVFRYINEENFYYFLVSNRGHYRLDVVFNGNPLHLIEWTPCPQGAERPGEPLELRLIARGEMLAFFLQDEWLAEFSDATLSQGYIGFAGQNYDEKQRAAFHLHSIQIDSRALEVEKQYQRWVRYVPPLPEARLALARTLAATGKFAEAAVQLTRALRQKRPEASEHLLLARVYRELNLYPEALQELEKCLQIEDSDPEALLEKAGILYQSSAFLAARDHILEILPKFTQEATLHGLLGSCEYSLGNWDKALGSFQEAARLAPEVSVHRVNAARCLERLGEGEAALRLYLEAARILFRGETYDELSLVLPRARQLCGPGSPERMELDALEAKMLFHEGQKGKAQELFRALEEAGHRDASVYYLHALLLIEQGKREEAAALLSRAVELEEGYSLYWFRLAENRFLLGGDPSEPLGRALALAPQDPWINNLQGQHLARQGRLEEALECYRRAAQAAPADADIACNHAEALRGLGRGQEAQAALTGAMEALGPTEERQEGQRQTLARLHNQRGNVHAELGEFAAALLDYEEALELEPDNRDYMQNCAACCLETDLVMRAEELLNRLLEGGESASLYNLTGNLAAVKGETDRARLAYLEGLKLEPQNLDLKLNLAALYLDTGAYPQAKELLGELLARTPPPQKAVRLQAAMREKFEQELECSGCGRQWWAPKELAPQPSFRLRGEPPGEAPAGRCESCGQIFCIACAAEHVREGLLMCPRCGSRLRLGEDSLKYLLLSYVESPETPRT